MKTDKQNISLKGNDICIADDKQLLMLAISNLRYKKAVVDYGLEMAVNFKKLLILFVNDYDFSICYLGLGGCFMKEKFLLIDDLALEKQDNLNKKKLDAIIQKAQSKGIKTKHFYAHGDFAEKTLEVAYKNKPDVIITTRALKYKWLKLFFGSHVDKIIEKANCTVIQV